MSAKHAAAEADLRWETRLLLTITAIMVAFGIANTYSASSFVAPGETGASFAVRQFTGAVVGGLLLSIVARIDYHIWQRWAWPLLTVTIVFLVVPLLPFTHDIAPLRNGARRWIDFGPISFQPSEVAKLTIVIWCAMLAAKKGDMIRKFGKGVVPFLLVLGSVSLLILLEPNLSMATLVALLGGIVLFTAGAKLGHFLLLGIAGVLLVVQQIGTADYRIARALTFLNRGDPPVEAAYQINQSLMGVGAGGLFGVGFGQGHQKLGYLPFAYSDFLFAAIGEEWGFLGLVVVVGLFATFLWLGFRIARTAKDRFGTYVAAGLTAAVGITAVLHMGVTLALLPTTGLPLPFMSDGRTSLVFALVGTGILVNVGRQRGRVRK
ncbi:MAG: putative peptidoglycan glycosyltransferase FtsW [Gemmatimonadales bacterium]